jgi:6-phosphogluconolactonase
MNGQQNKVQVFQTIDELSFSACKFIFELAKKAVEGRGRFIMSLSGGHTPEHLYTLLSRPEFRDKMPWEKTFVFWGDERCVSLDDKANNAHMAMSLLLDNVAIPSSNINRIPVNLSPDVAAETYEKTLKDLFRDGDPCFDLILLGLGENGHTASLFPGTDVLNEKSHWIRSVYVEEQKMFRITMTAPLINLSHNILFLVAGSSKASILKNVLTTTYETGKYPVQLIRPVNGNLYWFVDNKAAALLPGSIFLK